MKAQMLATKKPKVFSKIFGERWPLAIAASD
jgi:hypothetical protein